MSNRVDAAHAGKTPGMAASGSELQAGEFEVAWRTGWQQQKAHLHVLLDLKHSSEQLGWLGRAKKRLNEREGI